MSAVVPAAGCGARMGGADKLGAAVAGKPLLAHTLAALQRHEDIAEIIVVARGDALEAVADLCAAHGITKAVKVVKGGATRAESVLLGLLECHPKAGLAAIHDGARPCLPAGVITEVIRAARRTGAAAPGLPPVDTLKILSPDGRTVDSTPDRTGFVHIQTPQCFYPPLIKAALTRALQEGLEPTDDCAAVEALGVKVWVTPGDPDNFKVTVPGDLERAEAVLRKRKHE
ncbi:MAG: 2-C-methyl-D-erythritol 4-phosphate cytidylyltransferase [Oscillospiraceae bacterium]|nr:2-C-methyl-D-erythritol 4-phosphate cytidylyltransferase [Oscillospiraceae bacterium]